MSHEQPNFLKSRGENSLRCPFATKVTMPGYSQQHQGLGQWTSLQCSFIHLVIPSPMGLFVLLLWFWFMMLSWFWSFFCPDMQFSPDEEKRWITKVESSLTFLNFLASLSFSGQALNISEQENAEGNAYLSFARTCGKITHSLLVDGLDGERKCQALSVATV